MFVATFCGHYPDQGLFMYLHYWVGIVLCQRGGVSNEPPGQQQDMGQGSFGPSIKPLKISKLGNHLDKNFEKTNRTLHSLFLCACNKLKCF